ncbi:MAG: hypothetical protein JJU06_12620 [Ectothiorhodospiraceae bacterium]|nr:hypothetical protein [Ectothiorhodospiraceae bacterium]
MKRQTYTVKKSFPHRGEIVRPGAKVELHPRQAKYLIGTHLERPAASQGARKAKGGAKGGPEQKSGGDKQ